MPAANRFLPESVPQRTLQPPWPAQRPLQLQLQLQLQLLVKLPLQ